MFRRDRLVQLTRAIDCAARLLCWDVCPLTSKLASRSKGNGFWSTAAARQVCGACPICSCEHPGGRGRMCLLPQVALLCVLGKA